MSVPDQVSQVYPTYNRIGLGWSPRVCPTSPQAVPMQLVLRTHGGCTVNQTPGMCWLLVWRKANSHKKLIRPGERSSGDFQRGAGGTAEKIRLVGDSRALGLREKVQRPVGVYLKVTSWVMLYSCSMWIIGRAHHNPEVSAGCALPATPGFPGYFMHQHCHNVVGSLYPHTQFCLK